MDDISVNMRARNRQNEWIRKRRKWLIKTWGGKCQKCGSTEKLEFHHIQKTLLMGSGRGRKERYYDVMNNPKAYALLCKNCHVKESSPES